MEKAYDEKSADGIEYALLLGFIFQLFSAKYVGILCRLLGEDWHFKHEDIVLILQDLKSIDSVGALYNAVFLKLEYLNYDESYSLARKCIHALGTIDSDLAQIKFTG
ncbi:hypothetical protein HNQ91_003109 [Filimonas zeae]|uniref:hypothetical protein n=1 Tax=Filimonas zeae TaxID=1737353 RepID=UPI0016653E74|nr:hypothetical protein [Filimonas zeae]MDR6340044.1 hypothetical protein [Filimonas zeae]